MKPRDEYISLYDYNFPNQYSPYTWEGCVVKIADKIAYLGRDIQDAITIGILDRHLKELRDIMDLSENDALNNTIIINNLIYDLCENSNENAGLQFSSKSFEYIKKLKDFNYKYIYSAERMQPSTNYFELVIMTIYNTLKKYYTDKEHIAKMYPEIIKDFEKWLKMYWNYDRYEICKNKVVFNIENETDFKQAIIYYISGMTDNYAINMYNKIISF